LRILIYGAGAVGLGIGSCLLKSDEHVDFIGRASTVHRLRKNGLIRRGILGPYRARHQSFGAYLALGTLPKKSYDFILVVTKSFDSESSAKNLSQCPFLFHKNTNIILCQNGWGNAEIFSKYFPKRRIKNARVITGFTRPKPNEVTITVHADAVRMGSLFDKNVKELKEITEKTLRQHNS
jgi:2-dehydropantoate 2-reductase